MVRNFLFVGVLTVRRQDLGINAPEFVRARTNSRYPKNTKISELSELTSFLTVFGQLSYRIRSFYLLL